MTRRPPTIVGEALVLDRRDLAVAAFLLGGTVLTRIPFATAHLYAWDSTLYARALEHGFRVTADTTTESPHAPGYIWYVALSAAMRALVADSNTALVGVSIAAAAIAVAAFYLLARRLARESVAITAALAFAVSPLVWMYSEVAYPYTVLALLSLVLGGWMMWGGRPLAMSFAFGTLAGFRQDLLVLLAALWLWRVARTGPGGAAIALAALAAGCLTWAVPTVALSGGPDAYLAALSAQGSMATAATAAAGGGALAVNLVLTGEALLWGVLPLALILPADGLSTLVRLARGAIRPRLATVSLGWVLWVVPALAFYALIHIGEWGYVLSVVPPILLAAAVRIDRAVARSPGSAWRALAAAAVIVPAVLFVASDIRFSATHLRQRELELSSAAADPRSAGGSAHERTPTMSTWMWDRA